MLLMTNMSVVYSLVVLLLLVACGGRLLYEQYYGAIEEGCEMTWMYQWPQYLKVPMSEAIESAHPQYGLYLYTESPQKEGGPTTLTHRLSGVPVLFVHGNAGSHKQVRSSASIALRMHSAEFSQLRHFDFFTVQFNEEFSGLFGGVLQRQAEYVAACINHILTLYSHLPTPPQSVVIIAHSMGGVVARALFSLAAFNSSTVHTIIAMATPLHRPVISFDSMLPEFYDRTTQVDHVMLVSVAGGKRDVMVPTHLTVSPSTISLATPSIPRNWVSADHRAIVWCRRVQLALVRALFLLQDHAHRELTRDKLRKERILTHLLLRGREIPVTATNPNIEIKRTSVAMVTGSQEGDVVYKQEGRVGKHGYVGLHLRGHTPIHVTSNTGRGSWLFVCTSGNQTLLTCTDLSSRALLLPPKLGVVKSISLLPGDWEEGNSLLVISQPSNIHKQPSAKDFLTVEQCHAHNDALQLSVWGTSLTLPSSHCSLINFSLPHLQEVWQTYTAVITSDCGEVRAGLLTPWYPHTPLTVSQPHHPHNVTLSLSLLVPTPANRTPYLLVWSPPDCPLTVQVSPDPLELVDKLAVLYLPLLLPWVTAVCVAGGHWSLGEELLVITALYAVTSNGWLPYTDWQLLSSNRLWGGAAPLVLHLIARGLAELLLKLVQLVVRNLGKATCGCGSYLGWAWLVMSVPGVMVCSGIGGACLIVGLAFKATTQDHIRVLTILVCLEVLTLPAAVSWVRRLSVSSLLSPDPHFTTVLATICVTMTMAWLPTSNTNPTKRYSILGATLAVFLLAYCTVHAYRMTLFIIAYLIMCTIKQVAS